ncbi:MAG TPA: NAD(P)H-hydrate dehydratase, partial [Nitrososphaeraceae archaeon]|nr:NAD(P)H-hydrate dehydratase [Nitrososphaeraceae archaeon]
MSNKISLDPKLVQDLVVPRIATSKKGDNGIVLVVGGNRIYHGAPLLASLAALRSGTDLVYTAVPRSNIVATRSFSPNIIALPLPDDKLTVGSSNRLLAVIPKRPDSAAIGMGMTIAKPAALLTIIKGLLARNSKLVLDASALIPSMLDEISGTETIITPHIGEYKRIFGENLPDSEVERISNIQKCAKQYRIVILLKGWIDIISDGERVGINRTHNCAMTVGGTGDILTGIVAGLLTKVKPFEASLLG